MKENNNNLGGLFLFIQEIRIQLQALNEKKPPCSEQTIIPPTLSQHQGFSIIILRVFKNFSARGPAMFVQVLCQLPQVSFYKRPE